MIETCGLLVLLAQICVTQQAKLEASDGDVEFLFGSSVAQCGDRIVVGAPEHWPQTLGNEVGAAYVFERIGGTWQERAKLLPSNATVNSTSWHFGQSVACGPTRVVVGAPGARSSGPVGPYWSGGRAYVYVDVSGSWVEEAILDPTDLGVDDVAPPSDFGSSVDLDADTVIVGDVHGGAYVFVRSGSSWPLEAKLVPDDFRSGARFGTTVRLRGDTAWVGAPDADGVEPSAGAVYVFNRTGAVWTQAQKLVARNGRKGDRFGFSLAVDAGTLVVGAPLVSSGLWQQTGGAYVFGWDGIAWRERRQLTPIGYAPQDTSGWALALEGSTLVLGAPNEWFTEGSFHLYTLSTSGWLQHLKLTRQGGVGCCTQGTSYHDNLGVALDLEDRRLVVGAQRADTTAAIRAGAVFVFDIQVHDPRPTFYCTAKTDSKGCVPRLFHYGQPSLSGALSGEGYQVRGWELQPKVPTLLMYSTSGGASTPFAGGRLCLKPPIRRTPVAITDVNGMPCNGMFTFEFNAWIAGGKDPALTAGQPVWLQSWYRDPGGPPGAEVGLTQGIFVEICP